MVSWENMKNDSFTYPETGHSVGAQASGSLVRMPPLTTRCALFLDFDGTLADIALQPELVEVAPELPALLDGLQRRLDGAVAIITGRRLGDIDHFLAPLQLAAAAEHGAIHRFGGKPLIHLADPDLREVIQVAQALVAQHAGLQLELKSAAISLHYRLAPHLESLCLEAMAEAVKRTPNVELMRGKCVLDIKPAGLSKGSAIEAFMAQAPFAGRIPFFAGDDTTDEAGFAAVQAMGGEGIKIGEGASLARQRCASPTAFRAWLHSALEGLSA